jgi:ATP-dependent Lon protease
VLAAHRFGIDTVILPRRNAPDLDDVPDDVRKVMTFILAEKVDDVWHAALENPSGAGRAKRSGQSNGSNGAGRSTGSNGSQRKKRS